MGGALMRTERETHLVMECDHDAWSVFSDDPWMIAKLEQIATPTRISGDGRWYTLRAEQVLFRGGISEAKREAGRKAAQRLHAHQDGKFT